MPILYSTTNEDKDRIHLKITRGDTDTTATEKQYLLAVERGDYTSVHNFLEDSSIYFNLNINCVDALGRTALHIAIENENIEIIELLLAFNIEVGDALLFAIEEEVVQAVEILLNYKQPKAGKGKKDQFNMALMQGQKQRESNFTPDITPVILGAHKNNYEILKLLVGRGATIVKPHPVKCGCYECVHSSTFDSLRHSQTRMNAYRALASPSLMILASDDPILTAFELSWELYHLSFSEVEFKEDYIKLADQCTKFAVDLLDQTRGSQELKTILNRTTDPQEILEMSDESKETERENSIGTMNLSRFKLAIEYRQKEFIAHPNCQQLLSHIWYQGIPGWRQGSIFYKIGFTFLISVSFPFTAVFYILFPFTHPAKVLRNPFVKFINHSASYMVFLFLLILASQEEFSNVDDMGARDRPPNILEWIIVAYVLAFVWAEMKEIWENGFLSYSRDMWNIMDFMQNTLYLATISLRVVVYFGPQLDIERAEMDSSDPMLVAEALFSVANIFSTMRLLILFIANSQLGPLQISVGRMIIDIIKFLFIFALVIISFASGMNQLLYLEYASVSRSIAGDCEGVVCSDQNSQFETIMESIITLFWTVMGIVDLSAVSVNEDHAFTKHIAMIMYMVYHIIAIVILLNMLIAMMNLSYEQIVEHADVEWKFARSQMWMSYFEDGRTIPAPFSIIPSPKSFWKVILAVRTLCVKDLQELEQRQKMAKLNTRMKEMERKYQDVLTNLTQRYIANVKKSSDVEPVTEDDLNEIKQDISAFRYEVVELLRKDLVDDNRGGNSPLSSQRRTLKGSRRMDHTRKAESSLVQHLENGGKILNKTGRNHMGSSGVGGPGKPGQIHAHKMQEPAPPRKISNQLTVDGKPPVADMGSTAMNLFAQSNAANNAGNSQPGSAPNVSLLPTILTKGQPNIGSFVLTQDPNNPEVFTAVPIWNEKNQANVLGLAMQPVANAGNETVGVTAETIEVTPPPAVLVPPTTPAEPIKTNPDDLESLKKSVAPSAPASKDVENEEPKVAQPKATEKPDPVQPDKPASTNAAKTEVQRPPAVAAKPKSAPPPPSKNEMVTKETTESLESNKQGSTPSESGSMTSNDAAPLIPPDSAPSTPKRQASDYFTHGAVGIPDVKVVHEDTNYTESQGIKFVARSKKKFQPITFSVDVDKKPVDHASDLLS